MDDVPLEVSPGYRVIADEAPNAVLALPLAMIAGTIARGIVARFALLCRRLYWRRRTSLRMKFLSRRLMAGRGVNAHGRPRFESRFGAFDRHRLTLLEGTVVARRFMRHVVSLFAWYGAESRLLAR